MVKKSKINTNLDIAGYLVANSDQLLLLVLQFSWYWKQSYQQSAPITSSCTSLLTVLLEPNVSQALQDQLKRHTSVQQISVGMQSHSSCQGPWVNLLDHWIESNSSGQQPWALIFCLILLYIIWLFAFRYDSTYSILLYVPASLQYLSILL